ncbi:hypothetical protein HED60_05605 [Planctomycetales bacterium ZRK34]|nr:hypothetical protein HED60_05605 [Planctomycetales bacterium ZRK34]
MSKITQASDSAQNQIVHGEMSEDIKRRVVFVARRDRILHPDGTFDRGGRWYPTDAEDCGVTKYIRSPSRAYPYSYLVACRTLKHCRQLPMEIIEMSLKQITHMGRLDEVLATISGDKSHRRKAIQKAAHRRQQIKRFIDRVHRGDETGYEDVTVTFGDSYAAGNCRPGTDEFRDRLFGDDREAATIGEIRDAIGDYGEDVVLRNVELIRQFAAACYVAIRRQRRDGVMQIR